jgi:hypothetical protein
MLSILKKVNWRILTFLIEKGEASLSDIARQTKTTKANIFYGLKELSNIDIVRGTAQGKTHVYRFNFLSRYSKDIVDLILHEQQKEYNKKFGNIPIVLHSFLESALKENYIGCIFFGSSLSGEYKDIDVFIILKDKKNIEAIKKKLKLINQEISPIFGSKKELEAGVRNQDMLYKNIVYGISFGFDSYILKYNGSFLRKQDIKERLIIGYREVLSCLEFSEKEYVTVHLDKGVMDIIYAILNYFDIYPKNDREAISLFEKQTKEQKPRTVKNALQLFERYAWIIE